MKLRDELVTLAHGAGGKATRALVEQVFVAELDNPLLAPLGDAALLGHGAAMTTDAFVVRPLFFPGGDIGSLAVNGTVNDLAVSGAEPVALAAAFVIEEGFPIADLRRIAGSMAAAARAAGVVVATGDTKVVERGKGDGVYVTTTGFGLVRDGVALGPGRIRPGDKVVVTGTLGDHGIAVLAARGDLKLETDLTSDCAPVHREAAALLALGDDLRVMRDPTRGGLATTLNEFARDAGLAIVLDEASLPVRPEVAGACEILGLDPLYIANEGKIVAVVAPEAETGFTVIGEVREAGEGVVLLETAIGGTRIVDMLVGDPLPRIC